MDKFIQAMNTSYTANGALTNATTFNKCLDFFSVAGSRRDMKETFYEAFREDPQLALRILFWSRDCRGGAGSRYNFILVMQSLQSTHPDIFTKVFPYIPFYGYWKDLYKLNPTKEVVSFIANMLKLESDHSLCAKYAPRKGYWAYLLRKELNMDAKSYRKFIVAKTQVVEQLMCANKWANIDYSAVPSIAALRYASSFQKHDSERYTEYLKEVVLGKAKINADVLTPADVINQKGTWDTLQALWENLPNYMEGCTERILPICDVSGSMTCGTGKVKPMDVSIGLGIYIAEHNVGPFHNIMMSFSQRPRFFSFNDFDDLKTKVYRVEHEVGYNTNIQAVFDLLLTRAKTNNLTNEDMPTKLLLISDMEFDVAAENYTNFEIIKAKYAAAGYDVPGIVFWNVNGRPGNCPATKYDFNVAFISGYSTPIVKNVLGGKILNPIEIMLDTVNAERYKYITL